MYMKSQYKQPLKKHNERKDPIQTNKRQEIYRTNGKKTLKLLRDKM